MSLVINGLADQPKHFAELNKLLVVTSGFDPIQYVDQRGGRSGELGFSDWNEYFRKPTGVENASGGSLETTKFYAIVVTPLDTRRSSNIGFIEGNPTESALPVEIVDAGDDSTITWTIPVHPQVGISTLGSHTGSDGAAVLTDSTLSLEVNVLVGKTIKNLTDGSSSVVTANTATSITGILSGGTDNDWDTEDEYQVVDSEAVTRRIYASRGDTAADAWAGPFTLAATIEDNTTTTWEQISFAVTTTAADFNRFRPPAARFCHSAFNRIWYTGSVRELRGKVEYKGTVQSKAAQSVTITVVTSNFGTGTPIDGQYMRYTLDSGTWTDIRQGSIITASSSGGSPMNVVNDLASAVITRVEDVASPTWFEVLNPEGVAEATVTADLDMKPNYVVGNLSGVDQTFFRNAFVGMQFSINASPASPAIIAWVDPVTQEMGFTGNYGNLLTGQQEFISDSNIELFWSVTGDASVVPASNVLEVPGRPFAVKHIDRHVLVFTERSVLKLPENNIGQGFYTVADDRGCTSPYSIVRDPRGYTFFDGEGISRTDGQGASSISRFKADDYLRDVNQEAVYNIRGVYDPQEDQHFYVFPIGTNQINSFGLIINSASTDFYPIRLPDANALWRERSSDGRWNIFHGSTNRATQSGKSYIWEHDFAFESDGLEATEGYIGHVTSVDADNKFFVINDISSEPIVPGSSLIEEPYQYEGVPVTVVSPNASIEAHFPCQYIVDNGDGTHNVHWSDDFDLSTLNPIDDLAFFLGVIPIHFGPKFTDFGSPRFAHSVRELSIDFEQPDGTAWIYVDHYKDGLLQVSKVTAHSISPNVTKAISPCKIGKMYQYGYRIRCYSLRRIKIHNITITFTSHT